jgi:Ca2+/H+ antiporter, TMEM165/GDT1 family
LTNPVFLSLFFVFVAEMGDKTQLVALAFATRYRLETVLSGVLVATLLAHLFSVSLGKLIGITIPVLWVQILAGTAFIGFGIWTLRTETLKNENALPGPQRRGPMMTVAATFFLAELGDKTMLMTITLASQHNSFVGVWIGSTVGMVVADGLAIIVGRILGSRLPDALIRVGAATVFIVTGAVTLVRVLALAD